MHFSLVYIEKPLFGDNTAGYGIFLINNSDKEYSVNYVTGGYFSDDENIHKIDEKEKLLGILLPHSRILVEEGDLGQLDISGYVTLNLKGDTDYQISFTIGKGSPDGKSARLDGFENSGILMDFEIQ